MNVQTRVSNPIYRLLPVEVEGFGALAELALDMRWSWNHATDEVWRRLDPELWEDTHNPWVVLQTVSRDRIESVLSDPVTRKDIDALVQKKRDAADAPAWFQKTHPQASLKCAAYFSMEFMLSEALPIYSGGLGNVAGDQLKACSDLGVPVVGIGLLYQQGYFRQVIDKQGIQQELYPYNDPGQLPITPVSQPNGEWLRLKIDLPGYSIWLRAWQAQVGRVKLYLLDSNDAANFAAYRGITSQLYGGGPELRLQQEVLLGIGGWRLLEALGLEPEVCHLNEGHAAFAVLERAGSFMRTNSQPFDVALAATRAGNIFTTHTAVPAGFDRFPPALVEQYLGGYAEKSLGISRNALLGMGRENPSDPSESFNMAYLAIRGCAAINGVSRLHGEVSRHIFLPLFPHWPEGEIPVGHVTNGVHMPTWDSSQSDDFWTDSCGKDRWLATTQTLQEDMQKVSDGKIWDLRRTANECLIEYANERLTRQLSASGYPPEVIAKAEHLLAPGILTLGFARRFATYKRPNLLLHDRARLTRILTNTVRPVQLIIAGKAHPQDDSGRALIREWISFIRQPEIRSHALFLSDYDMLLTERLVQGVDVWINTPRRPWEACGTSGMKVLVNGGVNLSELDGWWAEAYSPNVGWSIGDGREHGDDPAWDALEADELYDKLESQVIPEFYNRDDQGVPNAWVTRIRESMTHLTPQFSADRAVREYTEQYYLPAAATYLERSGKAGEDGKQIVDWRQDLARKWPSLRFGELKVEQKNGRQEFEVEVFFSDLDPKSVRVELYADSATGAIIQEMKSVRQAPDDSKTYFYTVSVSDDRPSSDYTPRIVPYREGVSIPLECDLILWQR